MPDVKRKTADLFLETVDERADYFANWTYETPLAVSGKTHTTMKWLQKMMLRCALHAGREYESYADIFPLDQKSRELLALYKHIPYSPGTYRTDFVVDTCNTIKMIEITARFALNGFFVSGWLVHLAERYAKAHAGIGWENDFPGFWNYLDSLFSESDTICVIRGCDQVKNNSEESKHYIPLLRNAGYTVHAIPFHETGEQKHLLKDAYILPELSINELKNLPPDVLDIIMHSKQLNDLRTVFLIHDKRFFALMNNDGFLEAAIGRDNIEEYRKYLVPTYASQERPDLWDEALREKDGWIIKHRALGKGVQVFAGCVTTEEEWKAVFSHPEKKEFTLQPFIQQRKIHGRIGQSEYDDYFVGTMLFFDDNYFGPGTFRASSYPITNRVDDRKIAPLVTNDTQYFDAGGVL